MVHKTAPAILVVILGILSIGCTSHPPGERQERTAALDAGQPFIPKPEDRTPPTLPANPTAEDLVRYALLTNADLEQKYWEWRSAIEQIPQDGTQATNPVLYGGIPITNGSTAFNQLVVTISNDPMADIVWPDKLSVAARRTLSVAKAAGIRFQKAKYELRGKVLNAYYDYALTAELIRLEEKNTQLLQMIIAATEGRSAVGMAGRQDLLKVRNELDMSRNDIANMQSMFPAEQAALNATLNRTTDAPIPPPASLPDIQPIGYTDSQFLDLAARQNPELQALADEIRGKEQGIKLARLQYYPDFSISASTDLGVASATSTTSVFIEPDARNVA